MKHSHFFKALLIMLVLVTLVPSALAAGSISVNGPTVISSPGTYVLTKDISGGGSPAIWIQSSDVVFDGNGHTIDGTGASGSFGILVNGGSGLSRVTVKNVKLTNWHYGLYFKGVSNGQISGVTATNNNNAGICLAYSSNNQVTGCTSTGNEHGILLSFASSYNTVSGNTASNNSDSGVYVASTSSTVYDTTGNQINGNTLNGNYQGVYVVFSNGNSFSDNTVSHNSDYGIFADYASGTSMIRNSISGSGQSGVVLFDARGCIISGNTATGNTDYGIWLSCSSGNTMSGNTLSNNKGGIALLGDETLTSDQNIVNGNKITDNSESGLFLCRSSGNTITNNYLSNTRDVMIGGTDLASVWSVQTKAGSSITGGSTLGGNFWGTPSGTGFSQTHADANKDGICDQSYQFSGANVDKYPLVASASTGSGPTPTIPLPNATSVPVTTVTPDPQVTIPVVEVTSLPVVVMPPEPTATVQTPVVNTTPSIPVTIPVPTGTVTTPATNTTPVATPTATITDKQSDPIKPIGTLTTPPRDLNGDHRYEDVNGDGKFNFDDVVTLYNDLDSITDPAQIIAFDFNANARIDFGDVVKLNSML
jgi:parallel beta-helix repeat protein